MASANPAHASAPRTATNNASHMSIIGKWNAVIVSICIASTTIVLLLKSYVRIFIKRRWVFEDSMCVAAWVSLVAFCALMTVTIAKHAGTHQSELSTAQIQKANEWFNITSIMYDPAALFTKVAILLFYRRIFSPVHRGAFDIVIRLCIWVLCLFYFATTIVKIWECNPRARIWDKSIPGTCLSAPGVLQAISWFNLVTDIIILLVPVKAVWNMQLTPRKKFGVVTVFSLGLTAPLFAILGTVVRIRFASTPDETYNRPLIQFSAAAEITAGLICVCAPTLAALRQGTHRSQQRKPSHSILNGLSNVTSRHHRRASMRGKNNRSSLDEEELVDGSNIYTTHTDNHTHISAGANTKSMPMGIVTTGIRAGRDGEEGNRKGGGASRHCDVEGGGSGGDEGDEGAQSGGIMTSVRIEQSYV